MSFNGFPEGLSLLDELPRLDKEAFAAERDEWDHQILGPLRLLVEDLGVRLQSNVSPFIMAEPKVNGSISPINRDLRFAKDKSALYKDHVMLNFWEGPSKKIAPTLRLRISNEGVGVAAGAAFSPDALRRWRTALAGDAGGELVDELAALAAGRDLSFGDPELKKPPPEFAEGHPSAELARHKTFQLRFLEPVPDSITTGVFAHWAAERLEALGPIHRWLVSHTG